MRTATIKPGTLLVDTVQAFDALFLQTLAEHFSGVSGIVRYVGAIKKPEYELILRAGYGVMLVTFGGGFVDGKDTVKRARELGYPEGATIWRDLEAETRTPVTIIADVRAWANEVRAAGFIAGLYHGPGAQLTGLELQALPTTRYWDACSREVDRSGQTTQPSRGYCMIQLRPPNIKALGTMARADLTVDLDVVQQDFRGDLPVWAIE